MRIHPKDLKLGDSFYESYYGVNAYMIVIKEPTHIDGKWEWTAMNENGEEVEYLITDGYEHYGPSIYSEPAYTRIPR